MALLYSTSTGGTMTYLPPAPLTRNLICLAEHICLESLITNTQLFIRVIHVCSVSSPDATALRTFTGHKNEINTVCWSAGGTYLASCSDDSTAKIWTLDGLKCDLKGHLKEIYSAKWTPTGPNSRNTDKELKLCTASFDGTVRVNESCLYSDVIPTLTVLRIRCGT